MAETTELPAPAVDPEQLVFVRIRVKHVRTVVVSLRAAGFENAAKQVEDFAVDYTDPVRNAERKRWYDLAESTKAKDGEIEFDSDATISHSDDPARGQYVLGWVWVEDPNPPEDEEEDE